MPVAVQNPRGGVSAWAHGAERDQLANGGLVHAGLAGDEPREDGRGGALVSGPRTCSARGQGVAGGGCGRSGAEDVSSPAVDPTRRGQCRRERGRASPLASAPHERRAVEPGTITLERRTPAVAISIRGDVHADEKVTPPCEASVPSSPTSTTPARDGQVCRGAESRPSRAG